MEVKRMFSLMGCFLDWLCDVKAVSASGIHESSEVDQAAFKNANIQIADIAFMSAPLWTQQMSLR